MDKPSPINELLRHSNFPAESVLQRGQFLSRLDRLLSTLMDDSIKLHCQVGNIRDGVLILYCDSTAWAARLRYQTPALLAQLQQKRGLAALRQIEIKVLPRQVSVKKERVAILSERAKTCLQACADSVEDDGLRAALLHLSAHRNKETS